MAIPELNEHYSESLGMLWKRSTTKGSSKGLAKHEKNRLKAEEAHLYTSSLQFPWFVVK